MKFSMRRLAACAIACVGVACVALACVAGAARAADDYPNHPVRWLVGYPPGGSTDIVSRLIGTISVGASRPAIRHREQAGRRQQSGDRNGHQGRSRRLYGIPGQSRQRHQRHALQEPDVQFHPRHGAGRGLHPRAERDGGQPERAGENRRRVHQLRQGQCGQGQHGLRRRRHLDASVGRAVHDDDRHRARACALSRRGAGARRSARRPGAGAVRQFAVLDRSHQRRPAARAGGDHGEALGRAAGRADRRRDRARLRSQRVLRHGGAEGHAARRSSTS